MKFATFKKNRRKKTQRTIQATKQETFDFIVDHLLTQRKRSIDNFGNCVFRSREGSLCAIGALMRKHHRFLEGVNAKGIVSTRPDLFKVELKDKKGYYWKLWYIDEIEFLEELRHIHDHRPPTQWKSELKRLCDREQLDWKFGEIEKVKVPMSWYEVYDDDDECPY